MYFGDAMYVSPLSKWVQHGQGTEVRENKNTFIGEWVQGVRCGHGTCIYNDGNKFVGEFKDDK